MSMRNDLAFLDHDHSERLQVHGNRAGHVIEQYRTLYRKLRGAPYLGSFNTEKKDLDAALRLCEVFPDDEIEKLLTYWLEIPNGVDDFLTARNTRTLTMCLSKATAIAGRLGLKGHQG